MYLRNSSSFSETDQKELRVIAYNDFPEVFEICGFLLQKRCDNSIDSRIKQWPEL